MCLTFPGLQTRLNKNIVQQVECTTKNTTTTACCLLIMAGRAGRGRGQSRTSTRGRGRGSRGGRGGAPSRPPPPAAAAAHAVATGNIAGEDSPATRTRRQLQIGTHRQLQIVMNRVRRDEAAALGGGRRQREGDVDSPSTRTRRRLAAATHVAHAGGTGANAARLMRQLFSSNQPADTGTDDPMGEDDDDNNGNDDNDEDEPYEEEEEPAVANVAVAAAHQV